MASQGILELCDLGPKGELGTEICLILWRSERKGRLQQMICYRAGDETGAGFGREEGEVKICS